MKLKYIIYTALAVALISLIVYRVLANSDKENVKDSGTKAPARVSAKILEARVFDDNLTLSGTLEADEQVEIRSEVSGIVESINFEEGSNVKKGQILFRVNDIELRAELSKARTAQKLAAENERRAKLLLEKEAISQEEYEIVSADAQSARAQTQLINAQLSKAIVRAPFSGKIGLRSISKGTYITPTNIVANLVNISQIKITFSIPEKYASQMKVGNEISFSVAGDSTKYNAKIYALEPEIEIATRTLKLRAVTQNTKDALLPGTFASVDLPLQTINDALLVPSQVLIPIQNGKKIFVYRDGVAKEVIVETGARTKDEVLVTSGLVVGDTILTTGVMTLRDGSPVQISLNK